MYFTGDYEPWDWKTSVDQFYLLDRAKLDTVVEQLDVLLDANLDNDELQRVVMRLGSGDTGEEGRVREFVEQVRNRLVMRRDDPDAEPLPEPQHVPPLSGVIVPPYAPLLRDRHLVAVSKFSSTAEADAVIGIILQRFDDVIAEWLTSAEQHLSLEMKVEGGVGSLWWRDLDGDGNATQTPGERVRLLLTRTNETSVGYYVRSVKLFPPDPSADAAEAAAEERWPALGELFDLYFDEDYAAIGTWEQVVDRFASENPARVEQAIADLDDVLSDASLDDDRLRVLPIELGSRYIALPGEGRAFLTDMRSRLAADSRPTA